ncbi:hypothetical protein HY030_04535 [Candidatus Gottesmanbacteria bacterium]|nr:hypothetical protein [Candidatus Gottesmanbacteria bacterium]
MNETFNSESAASVLLDVSVEHQLREELRPLGIKPDSPAGKEFLFRARVFGFNAVNPPNPKLNE